jgi:hypothetical protein
VDERVNTIGVGQYPLEYEPPLEEPPFDDELPFDDERSLDGVVVVVFSGKANSHPVVNANAATMTNSLFISYAPVSMYLTMIEYRCFRSTLKDLL